MTEPETPTIVRTDPAKELADLCAKLHVHSAASGENFLASRIGVEPSSRAFNHVIFAVRERCFDLENMIETLDMDEDVKRDLHNFVGSVRDAFSPASLSAQWANRGLGLLSPVNTGPIKTVSSLVRQRVCYKKLSKPELQETIEEVAVLLGWLRERQRNEPDFIRQALIEGLDQLLFRLEYVEWLGWGYTLESFKEVIAAYMVLERAAPNPQTNPDAAAVVLKVGTTLKFIFDKVKLAKDVTDTGNWLVGAFSLGALAYHTAGPTIAGYLTRG